LVGLEIFSFDTAMAFFCANETVQAIIHSKAIKIFFIMANSKYTI